MPNIFKIAYGAVGSTLLTVFAAGILLAGKDQTSSPPEYASVSFLIILLIFLGCAALIFGVLAFVMERRYRGLLDRTDTLAEDNHNLELYKKAVEQSENSIVIMDEEGQILYVNP
ncbi:MAG: hypothetical protein ABFS19_14940, partial [Thermodesulfobacteriota bacterium]